MSGKSVRRLTPKLFKSRKIRGRCSADTRTENAGTIGRPGSLRIVKYELCAAIRGLMCGGSITPMLSS